MPNIGFRVDGSIEIGTGHIMRCLTLANALKNRGFICYFICRDHIGNLIETIVNNGHKIRVLKGLDDDCLRNDNNLILKPPHASWLGCDWIKDAEQTIECVDDLNLKWMIVDHYAIDSRWETMLKSYSEKLLIIDDLADRAHDCNQLIDQTLNRQFNDYKNLVPDKCKLFLGSDYTIIRSEFLKLRKYSLERRKNNIVNKLLINMGGTDKDNCTSEILKVLKDIDLPQDFVIIIVLGGNSPWINEVKSIASSLRWKTEIKVNVTNMAKIMSDSDFAIGAAGITAWERCCMGLPSILVLLASNQIYVANALESRGAIILIRNKDKIPKYLAPAINSLLTNKELRTNISKSASQVTDGTGVDKLILEMGL